MALLDYQELQHRMSQQNLYSKAQLGHDYEPYRKFIEDQLGLQTLEDIYELLPGESRNNPSINRSKNDITKPGSMMQNAMTVVMMRYYFKLVYAPQLLAAQHHQLMELKALFQALREKAAETISEHHAAHFAPEVVEHPQRASLMANMQAMEHINQQRLHSHTIVAAKQTTAFVEAIQTIYENFEPNDRDQAVLRGEISRQEYLGEDEALFDQFVLSRVVSRTVPESADGPMLEMLAQPNPEEARALEQQLEHLAPKEQQPMYAQRVKELRVAAMTALATVAFKHGLRVHGSTNQGALKAAEQVETMCRVIQDSGLVARTARQHMVIDLEAAAAVGQLSLAYSQQAQMISQGKLDHAPAENNFLKAFSAHELEARFQGTLEADFSVPSAKNGATHSPKNTNHHRLG